jgi:WhiB family redox-sensing transcriptional regulator
MSERRHGTDSSYKGGCRCSECTDAHRLSVKANRAKALKANTFTHGTVYGYDVGCRCADCRELKRRRSRGYLQTKRGCGTTLCPVCREHIGLYPDGSIAQHGRPMCKGSRHIPRPIRVVIIGHWRDYAACLGEDTEIFYPDKGRSPAQARRICGQCPVQAECLNDAFLSNERFGVRGGLTEHERRRARRAA